MNKELLQGNWKELKGKVKQKWAKLTDDDLKLIEGKREELAGRLQQRYGYTKEEVDREIHNWQSTSADRTAS